MDLLVFLFGGILIVGLNVVELILDFLEQVLLFCELFLKHVVLLAAELFFLLFLLYDFLQTSIEVLELLLELIPLGVYFF